MSSISRVIPFVLLLATLCMCRLSQADEAAREAAGVRGELSREESRPGANQSLSVEEIRALLDAIDPYLPAAEVAAEIDLFGSTSMDSLAHGWARGFKKFHPNAKVVVSAEGSETVFDRLAKNPASMGMLSRPVTDADLRKLKAAGLKRPVAILVARDALGVFVHESNPLTTIGYSELVTLFCANSTDDATTWGQVGVKGELADKPVEIMGRNQGSGTHKFVHEFLFHAHSLRADAQTCDSNAQVIVAISKNRQAIGIADLKCTSPTVRRLNLRDKTTVFDGDDHDVLVGKYPIIRPLSLVFDLERSGAEGIANRELVRYALTEAGQTQTILAGFFPCDPPTLRGELAKLVEESPQRIAEKPEGE